MTVPGPDGSKSNRSTLLTGSLKVTAKDRSARTVSWPGGSSRETAASTGRMRSSTEMEAPAMGLPSWSAMPPEDGGSYATLRSEAPAGRLPESVRLMVDREPSGSVLAVILGGGEPASSPDRVQPAPSVRPASTGLLKWMAIPVGWTVSAEDIAGRSCVPSTAMSLAWPSEPGSPGEGRSGRMGMPVNASVMESLSGSTSASVPV